MRALFSLAIILSSLVVAPASGAWPRQQSGGPIDHTGASPRIEKLKADLAAGAPGSTDRFWADLTREHTPIVEPIPGDPSRVLVTLVWRGTSSTTAVLGWGAPMELVPKSDVWYETFKMARDHRLWYFFEPATSGTPNGGRQPDPLNPHRFQPPLSGERPPSAIKGASPFMNSSILVLPEAPASPWVDPRPGVPTGRVEERSYESRVYGTARRIWVYTPSQLKTAAAAGLIICFWGLDYLNEIPLPTILDNLIAEGKVPPAAAIFVDNTGDRFQDFQSAQTVTASMANELLPWARANLHVPTDPRRVIVTGYSAAGLQSTYTAFRHPELFGNVLSQSGAFWRGYEGRGASEPEWLAKQYAAVPRRDTKFFLDVGGQETSAANGTFKDANLHLRDVLLKQGYSVSFVEVPGGEHEFIHWRTTIGDGLIALTAGWTR